MPTIPLSSSAISSDQVERRAQELIYEWYQRYFTGLPVTVGGSVVTFENLSKSKEDYLFGQASISQPSGRPTIHTVFSDTRIDQSSSSPDKALVFAKVTATITVRQSFPDKGNATADQKVRSLADQLAQIWRSEKHALAQKGIRHAKILRGPNPIASTLYATRLLIVGFTLQFEAKI